MFVLTNNVSAAQKAIATLLATALVVWSLGYYATAEAANLRDVSDLLSDSATGADSDHTITFLTTTAIQIGETLTVTFPVAAGEFDLTGVLTSDFDISDVANWTEAAPAAGVVEFTRTNGILAASTTVTITFDGTNKIANPSDPVQGNESYEIDIAGTMTDTGHTRVVILDTVEVTAAVDTVFDFTVYENDIGELVNGETTTASSSTTTIPFGTLSALTPVILSQDLTVQTNAINGFVVTVESDQSLLSSTGADIDNFVDNVIAAPETWESPSVGLAIGDENTWGHWGITSEDSDLNGGEFGANEWTGVTSTPRQVFSHNGPADEVTPDIGSTTIGFQVEISALQEAGDDYSTTLTYIATPTF